MMKLFRTLVPLAFVFYAAAAPALDLKVDDFQVTGTVSEKTDTSITVMKGKERFQIAIDKDTKMTGTVAVGGKVTIHYKMYAISVEAKDAKAPKPAAAKPATK